ncbi:transcriptional regulator [Dinoroseobacter shibae DFL 12 = DSM 16493]|jgi:DNA-binding GntR family transcriptional regulator|uniref:Transcriptional regulator n=1 Tax=Dinoroseobacter shibae (strain DSM 16493 / NCIMB 14021 / DFL 12) TaxID=398580 RepID=A8LKF4_DINSH|nr:MULTISPECIES: GntR family transcriptional regulator [Dinoroseobacter]ABV94737.1 transcriptional regulator [Dinoroseobacter shibae DFL 12 = DSM 16493]MDD9716821.1 GntR family transcriptional regulator [Dinoroseobacter sp. PD6]URF46158.1 GntR family transcriptional regulator [Dinoroseobacter shibae]URF50465.1 GntR family transcriptional regulator [Dinoroseobacter shibae]
MDTRRADTIAQELENMILTGGFSDGDRLNEIKLAEHFGVSRTPIREAFYHLGTAGLVEQIPRRGVFVRHPGPMELIALFEYMAELEAACGRLAAPRISDAALDDLEQANATCEAAVEAADSDGYYRENERFHHIIYAESGNSFLQNDVIRLHKRLKPFRRIQLQLRGRLSQSMAEHRAIVAALAAGDAIAAGEALRSHVAVQGEKFHHVLASMQKVAE